MQDDERWSDSESSVRSRLEVPPLLLPSTNGPMELRALCAERALLFFYPATGVPGRDPACDPAPGWDDIPGAAGCTPQSLGFKAAFATFTKRGVRVAGISTQPLDEQRDFATRHAIPFPLICDQQLELQRAWGLPTFRVEGRTFLKRMVLYIAAQHVAHMIYPVPVPAESAARALEHIDRWLATE
jgi:peroxiredoxin